MKSYSVCIFLKNLNLLHYKHGHVETDFLDVCIHMYECRYKVL